MKFLSVLSVGFASVLAIGTAAAGPFAAPNAHSASAVELVGANKTPGARVKGYVARQGGGYSYYAADSINTYGDARSKYGSASSYRDPELDKQSNAGPFDHGFFFDSAIGRNGGDSPYMN